MSNSKKEQLFLWMEDFDNAELPDGAWQAVLEDAVTTFNEENNTQFDPLDSFLEYVQWLSDKQDR